MYAPPQKPARLPYPVKTSLHVLDANEHCHEINAMCFCLVLQTAHGGTLSLDEHGIEAGHLVFGDAWWTSLMGIVSVNFFSLAVPHRENLGVGNIFSVRYSFFFLSCSRFLE